MYVYDKADYAEMRLFTTEDGNAGFALKEDGDLVSLFATPEATKASSAALTLAIQEGARKLDAFDTILPRVYGEFGFRAVARQSWDEEYIPDGWDKKLYRGSNKGEPDVVYMVYDPANAKSYQRKDGQRVDTGEAAAAAQAEVIEAQDKAPTFSRRLDEPTPDPYEARNRAIREQDQTLVAKGKRFLQRQLTARGLLPKDVHDLKIERDSEMGVVEIDIGMLNHALERAIKTEYGKPFSALTDTELDNLSEALKGDAAKLAALPPQVQRIVSGMRGYVDRMSLRYIAVLEADADALRAEGATEAAQAKADLLDTITFNLGSYIHRSYQAFDDPKWPRRVPTEALNNARTYLLGQFEGDPQADVRVDALIEKILKEGTAFDSMEAFIKESKLGAKDLSVLKRRQEIAPEIRALLGEYKDPRLNFAKSATKMSRLIFNDDFLKAVRRIGDDVFLFKEEDRPVGAYKKVAAESTEAYAPLNGLYTYPEVEQGLRDALGKENLPKWYRVIVQANGMVKYGKTVLSPTTAFRNFYSAFFFTAANSHFNLTHMTQSLKSMKSYFVQRGGALRYLRKLKQLGVVYDTPYAGEMMRLLDDTKIEEKYLSNSLSIKEALGLFTKFYQFGDDFWKIIGFENETALQQKYYGLSREEAEVEAARRIRDTYPTYSMVGRGVQKLRRFPLAGTFVSFPAEIVRTSFNMLRYAAKDMQQSKALGTRRLLGMGIAAGFFYALQEASRSLLDVDDDELEAIRDTAPPWSEHSNLMFTGRDAKGRLQSVDLSFLDPYNYWKRPLIALGRDEPIEEKVVAAGVEMLKPFLGEDITFGTVNQIWRNKKASGGRVYNEDDTALQQSYDILDHLRKGLQPGAVNNIEKLVSAYEGEIRRSGAPYSVGEEWAAVAGFRVSTFDPKVNLYFTVYDFKTKLANGSRLISRLASDPNDIKDSELLRVYARAKAVRAEAFKDMLEKIAATRKAGLSNRVIFDVLRANAVSERDARALLRGKIPNWRPTNAFLRSATKRADVLFDKRTRQEFIRRRRLLQKAG